LVYVCGTIGRRRSRRWSGRWLGVGGGGVGVGGGGVGVGVGVGEGGGGGGVGAWLDTVTFTVVDKVALSSGS
jgi:hypothetical protein